MELQHHGIRGMKWGVRRFQNSDGSLKPAGEKRYEKELSGHQAKLGKLYSDAHNASKSYKEASSKYYSEENKNVKHMNQDEFSKWYNSSGTKLQQKKISALNESSVKYRSKANEYLHDLALDYDVSYDKQKDSWSIKNKSNTYRDIENSISKKLGTVPEKRNPKKVAEMIGHDTRKKINDLRDKSVSARSEKDRRAAREEYNLERSKLVKLVGGKIDGRGLLDSKNRERVYALEEAIDVLEYGPGDTEEHPGY